MLIIGATRCVLLVLITVGCIYTCTPCPPHPDLHSWLNTNVCSYATATKFASSLHWQYFDPRDAITAQYQLWPVVCLSVCLSARHVSVCHMSDSEFYRYGWADRAQSWFWHGTSFDQSYSVCCKEVRIYLQNKGISLWNFIRTLESGLKILPRHVDRCNVMST